MVHHRKASILSLVMILSATCVTAVGAQGRRAATGFQVGQSFPEIAFPSQENDRPMSLVDFRGKKLLLHVFASW